MYTWLVEWLYVSNVNGVIVDSVYSKAVTVSSRLIRHYTVKTYGEEEYQLHIFFTWEPDGDEPPSSLYSKKKPPILTEWEFGRIPKSVWTQWWREKLCPCRLSNPESPTHQIRPVVTILPELPWLVIWKQSLRTVRNGHRLFYGE